MGVESKIVSVDIVDDEPILSINQKNLKNALNQSKNPDSLKKQTNTLISDINKKSDDYLSLGFLEDGKHDAELVDAQNAMQEISDKLNQLFINFQEKENISTDNLFASLQDFDSGRKITKILDLYREPTLPESGSGWLQRASHGGKDHTGLSSIGSKRQ